MRRPPGRWRLPDSPRGTKRCRRPRPEASVTVYSSLARRQLDQIQRVIALHAIDASSGRCVNCNVPGPCIPRRDADYALAVRFELPQRRPGATRPEAIGARRVRV